MRNKQRRSAYHGILRLFSFLALWVGLISYDPEAMAQCGNPCGYTGCPGSFIGPGQDYSGPSFSDVDFVTTAAFFYWYDAPNNVHTVNCNGSDALTDHPWYSSSPGPFRPCDRNQYLTRPPATYPGPPSYSMNDVGWWLREINDATGGASIDILSLDYWGGANDPSALWTLSGLDALNAALDNRWATGLPYPQIALFYDTTTLQNINLYDGCGKEWFYQSIRNYFSRIRPRYWARVNFLAVVVLYNSENTTGANGGVLNYARTRFAQDFPGNSLAFMGDPGWANLNVTYRWGASAAPDSQVDTYLFGYWLGSLSPGFNDGAVMDLISGSCVPRPWGVVPGPCYNPRNGPQGNRFQNQWEKALNPATRKRWIAVESWNEFHEGSEIAPTLEDGNTYTLWDQVYSNRHHFPGSWVKNAYLYHLGRPIQHFIGQPEYNVFVTRTQSVDTAGPAAQRDNINDSAEARAYRDDTTYIIFLYGRYLHRSPSPDEINGWLSFLAANPRSVARDRFINSDEAKQNISNPQFVTELYHQILGREPDPGGFNTWVTQLNNATPRSAVWDVFINIREHREKNITTPALNAVQQRSQFDFSGYPPE